ncbi:ATP-binding protein [Streptomyces sp. F63]|uniref:ATP-binding protein n=1 Tax=Streptomyces sp. F63 TaxID=2824887 RepID=UPI001FFDC88E|nr:ATP-binding protein [Streptomyces sp. F63]
MDLDLPIPPAPIRPVLTELRLPAYKSHRGTVLPLAPLTFLAGPSGSGKSAALEAMAALARLGTGAALGEVFPDPASCVPEWAAADGGRQGCGFRIGCTVDGPAGPVRLDVALRAEPELRFSGERLTAGGRILLTTAHRDPRRRSVQAEWHTAGSARVTRAPLPDDRLGTALLPLRVAGTTEGQRQVLAAAEQVVVALRSSFACDPRPDLMRSPVSAGEGRLRGGCGNLAEVLRRTRGECGTRHAALVAASRTGCAGEVRDLVVEELADGTVRAVLRRGARPATPVERLGDGELRYLALALVLLTGPGVLDVDPVAEVLSARQVLTVLADDFDRSLDRRQTAELLSLAARMTRRGHIRLLGTLRDGTSVPGVEDAVAANGVYGANGANGANSAKGVKGANGARGGRGTGGAAGGAHGVRVVHLEGDRDPRGRDRP